MTKRTFADFATATKTVQVIERIIARWVDRNRPRYRYATVAAIDRPNRICTVTYPGDTSEMDVAMGGVQPLSVGQTVRIDGLPGDRFIADVMGPVHIVTS